jgi:hypothetical protein
MTAGFAGLSGRDTGEPGLSSATLILGLRGWEEFCIAKGFGAPFGVAENMFESGCAILVSVRRVSPLSG